MVKVPSNAKGVVMTQVEWFQKPVVDGLLHVFSSCTVMYRFIEGSLEVKLRTIWTNEKQRWEESEKRKEERRSKRRESQKKEDPGARKGRESRNTVFFQ